MHLLIAYVIVRIAFGDGGNADQSGALATVSATTGGTIALVLAAGAFLAMALWRLAETAIGVHATEPDDGDRGPSAWLDRGKALSLAVIYFAFAWTAARFALGDHSSSGSQNAGLSARLMTSTPGTLLLVVVGVVVVCVGAYHVYKGVTRAFLDDLTVDGHPTVVVSGVVGYAAKGVVLAAAGVLVVVAAVRSNPSQATGLDGAVKTLGAATPGPFVLIAAAIGLAAYGVYAFVMARWARM